MKQLDPETVKHQISNLVAAYPELMEDDEDWSLALASETDLDAMLTRLVRMIDDARALSEGTDGRLKELHERRSRFERRVDAYRTFIFKLMSAAGINKRELAEATLNIRAGVPKVILTDEAIIPEHFLRIIKAPDKTKIKEALNMGDHVPGTTLSNSEAVLSIRVK